MVTAQVRRSLQGSDQAGEMFRQRRDIIAAIGLAASRSVRAHVRSLGGITPISSADSPGGPGAVLEAPGRAQLRAVIGLLAASPIAVERLVERVPADRMWILRIPGTAAWRRCGSRAWGDSAVLS